MAEHRGNRAFSFADRVVVLSPEDGLKKLKIENLRFPLMNEKQPKSKDWNWPKDEFGWSEVMAQWRWVVPVISALAAKT